MTESPRDTKLGVINGLRGLSILAVFCYHLFSRFVDESGVYYELGPISLPVSAVLNNAWIGVNVFFLLSGFVLFLPYVLERRTMSGEADVKSFYRRRFQRLMPLYYVSIVAAAIFLHFSDPNAPQFFPEPTSSAFYFDAFFLGTATFNFVPELYAPPLNWVLWSLGIEIWFSIIFPLLVYLARRIGIGRLTIAVLVVSLGTRLLGEHVYAGGGPCFYLDPIKDSVIGRLDDFVLGMLLCHLFLKRGPLGSVKAVLACLFGALGLYLACCFWDLVAATPAAVGAPTAPRPAPPFLNNLVGVSMFTLSYGALSLRAAPLRFLFTNGPLQILGMMCYSIYLWHGIAIFKLFTSHADYDLVPLCAKVVLILLFSALTYRYVEFGWEKNWKRLFTRIRDVSGRESAGNY